MGSNQISTLVPPVGQNWNLCNMHHPVAKVSDATWWPNFKTRTSGAKWWSNLEPTQEAPPGSQILKPMQVVPFGGICELCKWRPWCKICKTLPEAQRTQGIESITSIMF